MRESPRKSKIAPWGWPLLSLTPLQPHWPPCYCHTSILPIKSFGNCCSLFLEHSSRRCSFLHSLHSGLCLNSTLSGAFPEQSLKNQLLSVNLHSFTMTFLQGHSLPPQVHLLSPHPLECKQHQSFIHSYPQYRANVNIQEMFAGRINE